MTFRSASRFVLLLMIFSLCANAPAFSAVIFFDNFDDNTINKTVWTNWGNSVIESGQIMQVLQSVTDKGGNLRSQPIPINSSGIITIIRDVRLHYSQNYFIAHTYLQYGSLPRVGIYYGNMDYNSPPEKAVHGFYISRNDANPHDRSHNTNDVSTRISPIWDTWFKETIVYNPRSGILDYSINDVIQATFNVGVMPQTNSPSLSLGFDSWGWWTGYEHKIDNLVVSQGENSQPVVSNVRASQRAQTRNVDIYYNLASTGITSFVTVNVSTNNGLTYDLPAPSMSNGGNINSVGSGVTAGQNKWVQWNAGADWSEKYSDKVRFRINAAP